jgi:hypothetical protein
MPYFKNEDINLLFIHIPKTGGTSLELYFSSKFSIFLNNNSLFGYLDEGTVWKEKMNINSSLQHLTYNKIVEHGNLLSIRFDTLQIITIVRNPYLRIVSDLFFFKLITLDTTPETVFHIINEYVLSDAYDNHNIPQHKFLIDDKSEILQNVRILRTENLRNDMHSIGYDDFNIFAQANPHEVNYFNYLNDKSIAFINEFYHMDFVCFNYEKLLV